MPGAPFFLELYAELKKQYTLTDTGKDTYAGVYNVFLVVTDKSIYGISNNLTVTEFPSYVAKGAGSDYSLGCLYALYDTVDNGKELVRLALEAACHFCIYCREPLDIIEVKGSDFGTSSKSYKDHGLSLETVPARKGARAVITTFTETVGAATKKTSRTNAEKRAVKLRGNTSRQKTTKNTAKISKPASTVSAKAAGQTRKSNAEKSAVKKVAAKKVAAKKTASRARTQKSRKK